MIVTGYNKFIVRHESTDIKPDIKPEIKPEASAAPEFHSIIKDTEKAVGDLHKHEFQADTQMLLDTVARSLYSEKEVFILHKNNILKCLCNNHLYFVSRFL